MSAALAQAADSLARRDFAAAERLCLDCLAADPRDAEALQVLGVVRRQTGRVAEAVALLREAVRLAPGQPFFVTNLISALCAAGVPEDALAVADAALPHHPGTAALVLNRGIALHQLGRREEAVGDFRRAATLQADLLPAHYYLGCVQEELGVLAEAETALRRAVALDPGHADAHNHLGRVLHAAGRPEQAVACFARAAELAPDNAAMVNNLGSALLESGRAREALAAFQRAAALDPGDVNVAANLALAHTELMDIAAAIDHSRRALELDPERPQTHWSYSLQLLQAGQWREGWAEYEWRWRLPEHLPFGGLPLWDGGPVEHATLVVAAEQGHGDSLQFLRFVPALARRCRHVILRLQPALVPLAAANFPTCTVIGNSDPVPPADVLVPLMSLPRLLEKGCEAEAFPYLAPPPARVAEWRQRVAGLGGGLKVGLAWRGSPTHKRDVSRSMPPACLLPLFDHAGARFVCLHPDPRAEEVAMLPPDVVDTALSRHLSDFGETAALMAALDLVISVDSSPVHLAGALGRPCWVALPFCCDWRWGAGGDATPWYPSLRLFRQPAPGAWHSVIDELAAALKGKGLSSCP